MTVVPVPVPVPVPETVIGDGYVCGYWDGPDHRA